MSSQAATCSRAPLAQRGADPSPAPEESPVSTVEHPAASRSSPRSTTTRSTRPSTPRRSLRQGRRRPLRAHRHSRCTPATPTGSATSSCRILLVLMAIKFVAGRAVLHAPEVRRQDLRPALLGRLLPRRRRVLRRPGHVPVLRQAEPAGGGRHVRPPSPIRTSGGSSRTPRCGCWCVSSSAPTSTPSG